MLNNTQYAYMHLTKVNDWFYILAEQANVNQKLLSSSQIRKQYQEIYIAVDCPQNAFPYTNSSIDTLTWNFCKIAPYVIWHYLNANEHNQRGWGEGGRYSNLKFNDLNFLLKKVLEIYPVKWPLTIQ